MKKLIVAAIALTAFTTSTMAEVVCVPNYVNMWDPARNQYVTVRTVDICENVGPRYYNPPPAPQYYEPYPEPYVDNGGAEFFMGALIGGLTGYAIGNYNDNNNNNNNYYYYNGNGHRYKNHRYRERHREWRREDRREKRRHHRQKNRNDP